MKFSIITASYNPRGRYVRDHREREGANRVEWNIVQGRGLTDETPAVLQEYPHLKVTWDNGDE